MGTDMIFNPINLTGNKVAIIANVAMFAFKMYG